MCVAYLIVQSFFYFDLRSNFMMRNSFEPSLFPRFTFTPTGRNILLNALFSNTLNLCPSLGCRGQVSCSFTKHDIHVMAVSHILDFTVYSNTKIRKSMATSAPRILSAVNFDVDAILIYVVTKYLDL